MKDHLIAHLRKKDNEPQLLWDHLKEAAKFSKQFAGKIGLEDAGEIIGLLHDLGKASIEFQNYIGSATGLINPDADGYVDAASKKGEIDHSTAGAQHVFNFFHNKGPEGLHAGQVFSLCIASHHSGLIDCLTPDGKNNFNRRMEKSDDYTHKNEALSYLDGNEEETINRLLANKTLVENLINKIKSLKEENDSKETVLFKYGLLVRFLLSGLLDADRLSTADFENPGDVRIRNYGKYQPWSVLVTRLDKKIKEYETNTERSDVDEIRNRVSQACFEFAAKPKGIYQLTVPTGGGKTLASLRFALNHAAYHNMEHIFYVIPYTSIIDQNADEVRKILEEQNGDKHTLGDVVLEHHSNLTPEEETYRQNLLSQDWDAPVIFTTQVQYFEALFGSGTRNARRMHQFAKSVIIFDEVQTIPIRCVHMFNLALRFLVQTCGATVVLCTATQPLLDKIDPIQRALMITPEQHIIPDAKQLFDDFKSLRTIHVHDSRKTEGWSDEDAAELAEQELQSRGSMLIVVNTKKNARSLYQILAQRSVKELYHLSTNMCPAHRLDVLNTVKTLLLDNRPVVCVSTQLIEAGVDIDFGSVIRYLAGLDSIVQSAGRCNRHGKHNPGNVWIVNPREQNLDKLKDIRIGVEKSLRILDDFKEHPEFFEHELLGIDAMNMFYKYYFYERKAEMNYPVNKDSPIGRNDDLFNLLSSNQISVDEYQRINESYPSLPLKQSFRTAALAFHAIDSPTRGIVVPYGRDGEEIIKDLCGASFLEKQHKLLKKAQRYSVNLFPYELEKMLKIKAIHEVQEDAGIFYLDKEYYSDQFGWCDEIVNDMKNLVM